MKRIILVLAAILTAVSAPADPVAEIDYQGKVLVGDDAFTGTGYFKLALADADSATTFWSNDGTLAGEPTGVLTSEVFSGVFSLTIGDTDVMDALDPDLFSAGEDLYLRVWFSTNAAAGFEEMLPSQKVLSSPYAINAARVSGLDAAGIRAGLATGTPVYAESDPVWNLQKAGYATGTPLYVESPETDPVWSAASNLYYLQSEADALFSTGTPVYVEEDPNYADDLAGGVIATGTPVYAETDPVWAGASNLYYLQTAANARFATGMPVYVETDPVFLARSNSIVFDGDAARGDLGGTYPSPTVTGLQGRAVASSAPSDGDVLQWNGTAWAPAEVSSGTGGTSGAAGGDLTGTYPNPTIAKLQGATLFGMSGLGPFDTNRYVGWNGVRWEPRLVTPAESDPYFSAVSNKLILTNTTAGGDLAGTYPNPTVDGLAGKSIVVSSLASGDLLSYDGVKWTNTSVSAVTGSSNSYGKVNGMMATGQGSPFDIAGAGNVTVTTNAASGTNTVQISVPVPELQNVIWVATNGTPDGPGNIDSPYDTVGRGYAIAASRYAGQPATLIISGGTYSGTTNNLNMFTNNVHVIGLNRPVIGALQVRAAADPSLKGKQRVENLVFGTPSVVFSIASDVKIQNCRVNGILSVQGQNVDIQNCFMTNMQITGNAKNLAVYNSSVRGSTATPTVDITANGASNIQFIACEIVNTIGALALRGASSATANPPWHFSHNVIRGNVEGRSASTFMLNHNIIQGEMLPNSGPAMTQYFANNVIIGTNNWIQAEPATMDAYGNTVYSNAVLTIPSPWND